MSRQPCRSGKKHFDTRAAAEQAMHTLWARGRGGRLPSRTYRCDCGSWHLTSKPYRYWETLENGSLTA